MKMSVEAPLPRLFDQYACTLLVATVAAATATPFVITASPFSALSALPILFVLPVHRGRRQRHHHHHVSMCMHVGRGRSHHGLGYAHIVVIAHECSQ